MEEVFEFAKEKVGLPDEFLRKHQSLRDYEEDELNKIYTEYVIYPTVWTQAGLNYKMLSSPLWEMVFLDALEEGVANAHRKLRKACELPVTEIFDGAVIEAAQKEEVAERYEEMASGLTQKYLAQKENEDE